MLYHACDGFLLIGLFIVLGGGHRTLFKRQMKNLGCHPLSLNTLASIAMRTHKELRITFVGNITLAVLFILVTPENPAAYHPSHSP